VSEREASPTVKDLVLAADQLAAAKRLLLQVYGLTSGQPCNRSVATLVSDASRAEVVLHRDLTFQRFRGGGR
jgi:hypothetical protein